MLISARLRRALWPLRLRVLSIWYLGSVRHCPLCGSHVRGFFSYNTRSDAVCPVCGSKERDRLAKLVLSDIIGIERVRPRRMLHVAPELQVRHWLAKMPVGEYVTGDLERLDVDVRLDLQDMPFESGYFDSIYCSHVLEHVEDDRKAMRELWRVLSHDGWAVILVPITRPLTYEDREIRDPESRRQAFGQKDHLRAYGPDIATRLGGSGFFVRAITVADVADSENARTMALGSEEVIFLCYKDHFTKAGADPPIE